MVFSNDFFGLVGRRNDTLAGDRNPGRKTMDLNDNRLVKVFAELGASGKKTLLPVLTAGYPDLAATGAILSNWRDRGIRVCEVGFPFSDPIADGPVIQASYSSALEAGVTVEGIFRTVRAFRDSCGAASDGMALLAMVSYSIVFRYGVEAFASDAAAAGFDGLIVPDLPLGESSGLGERLADRGLCNVLLIAPTTPAARQAQIARQSTGFVYYISVAGITGQRDRLPDGTIDAVAHLREHTSTPVCVGFGIGRPETVAEVCRVADGAIVGSAIIHKITDAMDASLGREKLVESVGCFVDKLNAPIR